MHVSDEVCPSICLAGRGQLVRMVITLEPHCTVTKKSYNTNMTNVVLAFAQIDSREAMQRQPRRNMCAINLSHFSASWKIEIYLSD